MTRRETSVKTLLIIGNGPSTKELVKFGFKNIPAHIDTFGMGLAYKFYEKIGWWPTYYVCADQKLVAKNEDAFRKLAHETNSIERLYLPRKITDSKKIELIEHGSTGNFALRKGIELGYEQIYIIGIDLDYKPLKEASRLTKLEFDELGLNIDYDTNVMYKVRSPIVDHPNYFFPSYQEVGDIYSEPRGNSWHLLAWWREREHAERKAVAVRLLGNNSSLPFFVKSDLTKAMTRVERYPVVFPYVPTYMIAMMVFEAEKTLSDEYLKEIGKLKNKVEALEKLMAGRVGSSCKVDVIDEIVSKPLDNPKLLITIVLTRLITEREKMLRRITSDKKLAQVLGSALESLGGGSALRSNALKQLEKNGVLTDMAAFTSHVSSEILKQRNSEVDCSRFDAPYAELETLLFQDLSLVSQWLYYLEATLTRLVRDGFKIESIYRSELSLLKPIESHELYWSSAEPISNYLPSALAGHKDGKLLTFLIAIKNRNRRTNIAIESLHRASADLSEFIDILVVEDYGVDSFTPCGNWENLMHFRANSHADTGVWNKPKLLNFGLRVSKTKYVVMSDCDFMYANLQRLVDIVAYYKERSDLIFNFPLYETHASTFKENGVDKERPQLYPYSYVWVFNRNMALKSNGFNEEFVGWGFEETDMVRRMLAGGSRLMHCPNIHAFHFTHSDAARMRDNNNRDLFERNIMIPKNAPSEIFDQIDYKVALMLNDISGRAQGGIDILGNGPSTRNYNFGSGRVKMGFNVAYRYWRRFNVYPEIYVCLDKVVCAHHSREIRKLIEERVIKYFILDDVYFEIFPQDLANPKVLGYSSFKSKLKLFQTKHITTGMFGLRLAISLGYRKLHVWGMTGEYINVIEEAEAIPLESSGLPIKSIFSSSSFKGDVLRLVRTPERNPNYFFDDYQIAGDIYNYPYHSRPYVCTCDFHRSSLVTESPHVYGWDLLKHDLNKFSLNVEIFKH
jgi:hypothetical protein